MLKKILAVVAVSVFALGVVACQQQQEAPAGDDAAPVMDQNGAEMQDNGADQGDAGDETAAAAPTSAFDAPAALAAAADPQNSTSTQ